jgi:TolB-like protein/DNA-binding winged helix-turn-helix (wHTH) protein
VDHPVQSSCIYRFGAFEANPEHLELRKYGIRLRLQEKPFKVLIELLRRPGEVVTRSELRQCLWAPDTFVDFDEGVNTAVKRLRVCLGDSADNPIYIETVARYGYRFIAPVVPVAGKPVPQRQATPELVFVKPAPAARKPEPEKSVWDRAWLRISLITALVVLTAFAIYGNWWRPAETKSAAIQSLVVLPLLNLSGDASQDYFADGITDEITTDLAKLAGPRVISRTSAMQFKGTRKSVPEIARDLNAGAVVEGSVERSADRVRVRVQLIQASNDRHIWAEEYDRQLSDVFHLEADVAEDVAQQIQLHLSQKQRQDLASSRPVNPRAFQDYLQGRHYWALRSKESLNTAVEFFNRAIQEDPGDARSYAGLAHCYIVMPMLTSMPRAEAYEKTRQTAARALALDDSLPEAHLAVAESMLYGDWNFVGAEKEFTRTLQLNPNYSTGHQWYAEFLGLMGRHDEAIREVRQALALDPLSAIVHHQAANILRNAGHYDAAIEQYRETLKISPAFHVSYMEMSKAYREQGKIAESIQALQAGFAGWVDDFHLNPAIVSAVNAVPAAYAASGKQGYFRQVLKVNRYTVATHYYLAVDYTQLGDRDAAIAELTHSYESHDIEFLFILTDPELDPLRSDPRFQRLIRAIGFPY